MEKYITVEFSGWCRTPASLVIFQYSGNDPTKDGIISGTKWLLLSEDERSSYILENLNDVMKDSSDSEWTQIQIED